MGKRFVRIVIWLGVMAALTLLCMGLWLAVFKGSRTTESLKWLQLMQTAGTFLLPPVLCAMLWDENRKPFSWLGLSVTPDWQTAVLAVGTMLAAVPAINLLADLNNRFDLPESLDSIERIFRQQEETAALLTERFLQADNVGGMLLNIGLLALLPALSEELTFRGTLQQVMMNKSPITYHQSPITNNWNPYLHMGDRVRLFRHSFPVLRVRASDADGRDVRLCVCLDRQSVGARPDAFHQQRAGGNSVLSVGR